MGFKSDTCHVVTDRRVLMDSVAAHNHLLLDYSSAAESNWAAAEGWSSALCSCSIELRGHKLNFSHSQIFKF